jgi:hypothetical protein
VQVVVTAESSMRKWATDTCSLGWTVKSIWARGSHGNGPHHTYSLVQSVDAMFFFVFVGLNIPDCLRVYMRGCVSLNVCAYTCVILPFECIHLDSEILKMDVHVCS